MKFLYLLLTRSTSLPSRLIGLFTSEPFTHISLAFDRELTVLYSFARKYPAIPLPAGLMEEQTGDFTGSRGIFPALFCGLPCRTKFIFTRRLLSIICFSAEKTIHTAFSVSSCAGCTSRLTVPTAISAPSSSEPFSLKAVRWSFPNPRPSCTRSISVPSGKAGWNSFISAVLTVCGQPEHPRRT